MTYLSGFSMPGAFHNDGATTAASQPLIFRPPVSSPSPSSSAFLDAPRRKRGRAGTPAAAASTDDAPAAVSLFGAAAVPQHTPVKAYALAGTLDTPGVAAESDVLGESMYSDSNYRTALGSKRSRHDDDDDSASGGAPTSLFRHNPPPSSPSQGWGTAAIHVVGGVVGGVVGRVWEFCKAGAFKGFYAGGGRGFAMTETGAMVESDDAPLPPADDYSSSYSYHYHHYDDYEHRVPGHFPASQPELSSYRPPVDDDSSVRPPPFPGLADDDHDFRPASPAPSIPAAKRRQTTHADDLGRNWVLVNDAAHRSFPPAATPRKISSSHHRPSPRNRNYTPSVTTGRRISTTPTSRASMPSAARFSYRPETPSEPPTPQLRRPSSASYASPRSASPTKPTASAAGTSYYTTTASTASTASPSASQPRSSTHRRRRSGTITSTHRRANSAASAASSRGGGGGDAEPTHDSPRLDAEAKHLAARRKMEERDADVRISAFNKRLQDMIRQGKEALGTTIEIDDDDDAGGDDWVDEE